MKKPPLPNSYGNSFIETVAIPVSLLNTVFSLLIATILAVFFLGNLLFFDKVIVLRTAPVAGISIVLAAIFYTVTRRCKSVAWGVLAAYGLLFLTAYVQAHTTTFLFYVLGAISTIYLIKNLQVSKTFCLCCCLVAIFSAVILLGTQPSYTSFNLLERLAMDKVHQDTLFHSSIAAMLKHYGTASTGLHALIETPYHVFSHWLTAGASYLVNVGVFEIYGSVPVILFIPFLLLSVVTACLAIDSAPNRNKPILLWGLAVSLLAFTFYAGKNFAFLGSHFTSESYTVSLTLLMTGLPLLYKRMLALPDIIALCLLGAVMGMAKASVGLIFMGLWWIRTLFFTHAETKTLLATATISLAVCIPMVAFNDPTSQRFEIIPFLLVSKFSVWGHYIEKLQTIHTLFSVIGLRYLLGATVSIILFTIVHFSVSWLAVAQSYTSKWKSVFSSPTAVYSLASIGCGLFIATFSFIPNSSVYYFSNVAFFISLPTCLLLIYDKARQLPSRHTRAKTGVGIVLLLVVCFPNIKYMHHLQKEHLEIRGTESAFIKRLLSLRDERFDQCYLPTLLFTQNNPVSKETARPFVYPAISEHPWIGVITPLSSNSRYQDYGYERYGLCPTQQIVTIPPKLATSRGKNLMITQPE